MKKPTTKDVAVANALLHCFIGKHMTWDMLGASQKGWLRSARGFMRCLKQDGFSVTYGVWRPR